LRMRDITNLQLPRIKELDFTSLAS
jgi:hypothetical protein